MYSAANLNRPLQKCHVCKLDHPPLKESLLQKHGKEEQELREKTKQEISAKMVQRIDQAKKRKTTNLNKDYIKLESGYKELD